MFSISPLQKQDGNVLVILLIAIILFGALSFAVSGMMRGGMDISESKNIVAVSDILSYARSVKEAASFVRISNECDETEISFERNPFDGSDTDYVNAGSPPDFSCHIFHPSGGGISPIIPMDNNSGIDYFYSGGFAISDIGDNANAELSMLLTGLTLEQCTAINQRLGLAAPAADTLSDADVLTTFFQGAYSVLDSIGSKIGTGDTMYDARPAGCIFENNLTSGTYIFYQVLLPR